MKEASCIFWLKAHILHMRKLKPLIPDIRSQIPGFRNQILLGKLVLCGIAPSVCGAQVVLGPSSENRDMRAE